MPEVHIIFLNTKVQMLTLQMGMPTCDLDAFAGAEAKWGGGFCVMLHSDPNEAEKPRKTAALLSLSGLQDYARQRLF